MKRFLKTIKPTPLKLLLTVILIVFAIAILRDSMMYKCWDNILPGDIMVPEESGSGETLLPEELIFFDYKIERCSLIHVLKYKTFTSEFYKSFAINLLILSLFLYPLSILLEMIIMKINNWFNEYDQKA